MAVISVPPVAPPPDTTIGSRPAGSAKTAIVSVPPSNGPGSAVVAVSAVVGPDSPGPPSSEEHPSATSPRSSATASERAAARDRRIERGTVAEDDRSAPAPFLASGGSGSVAPWRDRDNARRPVALGDPALQDPVAGHGGLPGRARPRERQSRQGSHA